MWVTIVALVFSARATSYAPALDWQSRALAAQLDSTDNSVLPILVHRLQLRELSLNLL